MGERVQRIFELRGDDYPRGVVDRLKNEAPRFITAIGSTSLLGGSALRTYVFSEVSGKNHFRSASGSEATRWKPMGCGERIPVSCGKRMPESSCALRASGHRMSCADH